MTIQQKIDDNYKKSSELMSEAIEVAEEYDLDQVLIKLKKLNELADEQLINIALKRKEKYKRRYEKELKK